MRPSRARTRKSDAKSPGSVVADRVEADVDSSLMTHRVRFERRLPAQIQGNYWVYQKRVDKGFIYIIPKGDAVVFDLTEELKTETLQVLDEIRSMTEKERMPAPTPVRNRCTDCEYRNFCGDIF